MRGGSELPDRLTFHNQSRVSLTFYTTMGVTCSSHHFPQSLQDPPPLSTNLYKPFPKKKRCSRGAVVMQLTGEGLTSSNPQRYMNELINSVRYHYQHQCLFAAQDDSVRIYGEKNIFCIHWLATNKNDWPRVDKILGNPVIILTTVSDTLSFGLSHPIRVESFQSFIITTEQILNSRAPLNSYSTVFRTGWDKTKTYMIIFFFTKIAYTALHLVQLLPCVGRLHFFIPFLSFPFLIFYTPL